MADYSTQVDDEVDQPIDPVRQDNKAEKPIPESEKQLVHKIQKSIKTDKTHHKKAYDQMRADMFLARTGRIPEYPVSHYTANLVGRHIKQKTASLYAKNPKAVARRRETMDFVVWDENPQSLMMAMQTIQMAQQILMQAQATTPPDPLTGEVILPDPAPEMQQAFMQAQSLVADFQQGMARRQQIDKVGKTLELLYAQALREQKPVDFKSGMKQMVRRACTTGVGYVELGFQRTYGPRPEMTEKMADARTRLDHLKRLTTEVTDPQERIHPDDPEIAELQLAVTALQSEPEIVLREGLVVDYPQATKVIPDKLCRQLVGLIGARHVTIEYLFTVDQVKEMFEYDIGKNYTGYKAEGQQEKTGANYVADEEIEPSPTGDKGSGLVCVWKRYDKPSGLVFILADGCDHFLKPPAAPDVFVEDFWPLYALTFNAVESEDTLYPPSDVFLMTHQQMEYNRSRQGMREHRRAARPRWIYPNGVFEEEDVEALKKQQPFEAIGINLPPEGDIAKILQAVPVPGVDPNLYETGQLFTDIQLTVGSSEAQFGGVAQATATESAIAANSSATSDGAAVDDLDAFLTVLARASGQILLKEMSEEEVKKQVGPGALWPHMQLSDIASELFLEVEAGSSGKPNQAIEVENFKQLAPLIMQIPGISPYWLAKEAISRLDDRIDLTEAIASGIPSIVAQNQMQRAAPGAIENTPEQQGPAGNDNAQAPPAGEGGGEPAFGSNQV